MTNHTTYYIIQRAILDEWYDCSPKVFTIAEAIRQMSQSKMDDGRRYRILEFLINIVHISS